MVGSVATAFLALDPEACKEPPFNTHPLLSLPDYFRSLHIPGSFNWQSAVVTLMLRCGLSFLLPVARFVPKGQQGQDPLERLGGSQLAMAALNRALSPLHLYSLGELANLAAAQSNAGQEPSNRCIQAYLAGHQDLPKRLRDMANPYSFERDLPAAVAGLAADAPADVLEGDQTFAWLPDLALVSVGLRRKHNAYENMVSTVVSILLNRLSANRLPAEWCHGERCQQHSVRLTDAHPAVDTPEALLEQIVGADPAAHVYMAIVSRTTSFGIGAAVRDGEEWKQVPVAFPMRTGLSLLHGEAASSGSKEIVALTPHAEVCLRVRSAALSFSVCWYQGIEGFTGWHPAGEVDQPWANSADVEVCHQTFNSSEDYAAVFQATAAVSAVTNVAADRSKLPNGGYGYLGVCNDSVATVQAGIGARVTMFPCILGGFAKTSMSQMYQELSDLVSTSDGAYSDACLRMRDGLLRTPCDVVQQPATMMDTARRVRAVLPQRSPYAVMQCTRADLLELESQLQEAGIADKQAVTELQC